MSKNDATSKNGRAFTKIAFSQSVQSVQNILGSRPQMERMETTGQPRCELDENLTQFISARTSFYLGTSSTSGEPYIQHRGGEAGFIEVIDNKTLKFADYPLAPLLIGFILGGMLENNFARSMQLYDGVSFIWERPMTLGLLVIAALLVVLPSYRERRARARAQGVAEVTIRRRAHHPCHVAHFSARPRFALSIKMEPRASLGGDVGDRIHVIANEIGHHHVRMPDRINQGPARNSADVLFELADGAAVLGPVS